MQHRRTTRRSNVSRPMRQTGGVSRTVFDTPPALDTSVERAEIEGAHASLVWQVTRQSRSKSATDRAFHVEFELASSTQPFDASRLGTASFGTMSSECSYVWGRWYRHVDVSVTPKRRFSPRIECAPCPKEPPRPTERRPERVESAASAGASWTSPSRASSPRCAIFSATRSATWPPKYSPIEMATSCAVSP